MALTDVRDVGLARMSIVATGLLGLFGIFASERSRRVGRAMVIAGGAVALIGPMPDELEERD